jgi:hypothetical protein
MAPGRRNIVVSLLGFSVWVFACWNDDPKGAEGWRSVICDRGLDGGVRPVHLSVPERDRCRAGLDILGGWRRQRQRRGLDGEAGDRVLAALVAALRPGGWLAVEGFDSAFTDGIHPRPRPTSAAPSTPWTSCFGYAELIRATPEACRTDLSGPD